VQHRLEHGSGTTRRVTAIAGLVAALTASSTAQASFPGGNGRLAVAFGFVCDEGREIATMRPDGADLRLLTDTSCNDDRRGRADMPDWAPDGRRLVFLNGNGPDPSYRPALMAADGSGTSDLPLPSSPPFAIEKPSFAPDGGHLAYTRARFIPGEGPRASISRAAIDGSDNRRLGSGSRPRWSPNGRRIAFVAPGPRRGPPREGGTWLMNARTGDRIRRISRRDAAVLDWAPDGRTLLFAPTGGCRDCDQDLSIVRTDGTRVRRLTATPARKETDAVWSPDGRRIAFVRVRFPSEETSQYSLWIMSAHGTRERRIFRSHTRHLESDSGAPWLTWQPHPR
jgi:Tol biopolymer transport system component